LLTLDDIGVLLSLPAIAPTADTLELWLDGNCAGLVDTNTARHSGDLLEGVNQLVNPGFADGLGPWRMRDTLVEGFTVATDFSPEWTLQDGHTAYIYQKGDTAGEAILTCTDPVEGDHFTVKPKGQYRFMGHFGLHRCVADVLLEFSDDAGCFIDAVRLPITGSQLGGTSLASYLAIDQRVTVPAKANRLRLSLIKHPTQPGKEHSFLFFTRLFWGVATQPLTAATPWQDYSGDPRRMARLRAGVSTGAGVIHLNLPEAAFDGHPHTIVVKHRESGQTADGSPLSFRYANPVTGQIDRLEGTVVCGWVRPERPTGIALAVTLWVDDRSSITAIANQPHAMGQCGFRLPLPTASLDGWPHTFTVRVSVHGPSIGTRVELLPHFLTPWDVLHANTGLATATLASPATLYRHRSLLQALKVASGPARTHPEQVALWRERLGCLNLLHDILATGFEKNKRFPPLCFPRHDAPMVSIVIPVHNKFAVTYHCLAALLFAFNEATFEVIVVDDGSTDQTKDIVNLISGIKYLGNPAPKGFVEACNAGAAEAVGHYVVFLNNDTEPTVAWLDELLYVIRHFDGVGLVGSKLIYADGRLQEAGGIVWKTGDPWNYGRGGNAQDPRYNYTRQVDYLSGAAILLPRTVWQAVGGFSEAFRPAYFEDTDLAFKVRACGYKTVYAPASVVYHFEGLSSGTDTSTGMKKYQEINRPTFKARWIQACQDKGEVGQQVELNKDRGVFYRALVIDYQMPRPDRDAGSYAAIQEMRLLQALGFKVSFVADNLAYLGEYNDRLQRMGIEVIHAPFVTSITNLLEQRGQEFDLVYITRYYVAKNHLPAVRQFAPRAKVLFCNADLHFLREMRAALQTRSSEQQQRAEAIRAEELAIMKQVDVTLSYNLTEHAVIQSHNGLDSRVALCPWVVDTVEFRPLFALRQDIAFIGGFGHPPNQDAVLFFVREVMPHLSKRLPEARFIIYGSQIPPAIEALASARVIIGGAVERVSEVFETCRVFVAPLQSGAGVKGKVMDALSYGVPCVLSELAAEGIALRHGMEALIARTPQEWVEAVHDVYRDHILWQAVSAQALQFVRENHSFEAGKKLMRQALLLAELYPPDTVETLVFNTARVN
jgi:GT2 family glycosyltransferase/glycosyltransferase involved in cell wall biosynthesis